MPLLKTKNRTFRFPLFLKLSLSLISILVCLVVLEILLAFFYPQKTYKYLFKDASRCWQNDEYYNIKFRANCKYVLRSEDFRHDVTINSQGFRGKEVAIPKANDTFRIVFTGDSFVFGNGLRDNKTIPYLVEQILNEEKTFGRKKAEVINAGFLGGRSPDGHLVFLRHNQFEADMNIMGFFVYNDFTDMYSNEWLGIEELSTPKRVKSTQYLVTGEGLYVDKESDLRGIYSHVVLRNFNTYVFFSKNFSSLYEKTRAKLLPRAANTFTPEASDSYLYGVNFDDCLFGGGVCHRRLEHLFFDLERVFVAARNESPKQNFGVVLIPGDFQVYVDAAQKYKLNSWAVQSSYLNENPQPQARVKSFLEQNNIHYLDLLYTLRENKEPKKYYPNDAHFNDEGAKLVAEEIASWISQQVSERKIVVD